MQYQSIINRFLFSLLFLCGLANTCVSQISIGGPACGQENVEYNYFVTGNYNSSDNFSWIITNGVSSNGNSSESGTGLTFLRIKFTGSGSISIQCSSGNASLNVTVFSALNPGSITANSSQTINYNATPGQISCSVASGGSCVSTYTYQWQQSIDNINWTDMSAKTSQNLSFSSGVTQTTYFRRKVTNGSSGPEGYSNTAIVFVNPPLTAGSVFPTSQSIFVGVVPASIGGGSANGGSCSGYSYQWEYSADGTTFFIISGANSMGYSPDALSVTTYFRRKVTCSADVAYTSPIVVNVYPHLAAGSISPSFANILFNTSPGQLTGTAATGGICTSYSYQWEQSTDNTNWTDIQTAINQNYTPGNLTTLTYFRRKVICGIETVYTNISEISLYNSALGSGQIITAPFEVEYNTIPSAISATASAGGTCSTYSYQWQYSTDNLNFTNIPGAISQNLTFSGGQTQSYYYRRMAQCGSETAFTNSISINIIAEAGAVSCSQVIDAGGSPGAFTISGSRGGAPGITIGYQWESSMDEITWTSISAATSANYTPPSLTTTTYYRVRVGFGTYNLFSNILRVKVKATPNTSVVPNQTVLSMPSVAGLDANNINFLRTRTVTKRGVTDPGDADLLTANTDVTQVTEYLDGLGRPIQTVAKNGTPSGADMIMTTSYDNFGRVAQKYLAYTDNQSSGNFRTNASTQQPGFYNSFFNNTENYYYSNSVIESSPLNRVLQQTAPGNRWTGSAKGVRKQDRFNRKEEDIKVWSINTDNGAIPAVIGVYNKGELFVSEITDESENKTIEYQNKEGQVLLKKVLISDTYCEGYSGWLSTYYIYDDFGLLRWVIQPKGVDWLRMNSWNLGSGTDVQTELCFRYEYDERGRMIIKKVPGADETRMAYDVRDRLVFLQDGKMRNNNQWLTTLYDQMNRKVLTGMTNYTGTHTDLRAAVSAQTLTPTNPNTSIPIDVISNQSGTTGTIDALRSITLNPGFDATTDTFTAEIVAGPSGPDGESTVFDNVVVNKNPIPTGTNFVALTKTYYDNYDWSNKQYTSIYNANVDAGYNNLYPESLPSQSDQNVLGKPTINMVRVIQDPNNLSSGAWLTSVIFYDDKGRPVQAQADNYQGGNDISISRYDFSDKILTTYLVYNNPFAPQLRIKTNLEYDAGGRLIQTWKTINDATQKKLISNLEYNDLGQLKKKILAPAYNSNVGLETENFEYNIRGWMLGMNRDYTKDANSSNFFGFDLGYDKANNSLIGAQTYVNPQYNGNIAGMVWKSKGDGEKRKYDFTYDAANRIIGADFNQYTSGTFNKTANVDFSVSNLSYDANGNILTMDQKGLKLNTSSPVDQMRYTYIANANKLLSVVDFVNDAQTKLGDFRTADTHPQATAKSALTPTSSQSQFDGITDYAYDANGNLQLDKNKAISSITYNHLNLPSIITLTGNRTITYTYDAAGVKLQKTTVETTGGKTITTITTYVAGEVFESKQTVPANTPNDDYSQVLQFVSNEEGRIRYKPAVGATPASYEFDYFLKDHLGNVRMVLTEESKTDMYPAATMETASATTEETYYSNLPNTRTDAPEGFGGGTPQKVAKVNGSGNKIGPAIILKVMAGDKFSLAVNSWWNSGNTPGQPVSPLAELLSALNNGIGNIAANHGTPGELTSSGILSPGISSFLNSQSYISTKPKAFVNWVLFDEQFKYVSGSSNCEQVEASNVYTPHVKNNLPIDKNGYLYIYVSNETPNIDVFFDNLQVSHIRGPLLEETHYYPFGLTMAGISSKALNGVAENKKKYQQYEFNSDFDINLYESFFRTHDPQLGRFWQIDPKPYESASPYAAMLNNPLLYGDLLGDTAKIGTITPNEIGKRTKADVTQQLIGEWSKLTGLKLSVDGDGNLVNGGIATNKGISKTARKDIMDMISSDGTVYVDFTNTNASSTSNASDGSKNSFISMNVDGIDAQVAGTSKDLNKMTAGMGMSVLHEMGHTFLNGNLSHSNAEMTQFGVIGAIDQKMNQIRKEMGVNWGQRLSYTYINANGYNYIPMNGASLKAMQNILPAIMSGNNQNIRMPSTGIIKQKSSIMGQILGRE